MSPTDANLRPHNTNIQISHPRRNSPPQCPEIQIVITKLRHMPHMLKKVPVKAFLTLHEQHGVPLGTVRRWLHHIEDNPRWNPWRPNWDMGASYSPPRKSANRPIPFERIGFRDRDVSTIQNPNSCHSRFMLIRYRGSVTKKTQPLSRDTIFNVRRRSVPMASLLTAFHPARSTGKDVRTVLSQRKTLL
jgi:hypothetical protein